MRCQVIKLVEGGAVLVLSDVFNERGYLAIPPCLFGYQPGLRKPFSLGPDTKLRAVQVLQQHLQAPRPDGTVDGARGV